MSMPLIRHEVAMMLMQANEHIADEEKKLAEGTRREKVDAAGELSFLRRQKETLEERLREIDDHPEANETLLQWIKEEVFNLQIRLQSWAAHA